MSLADEIKAMPIQERITIIEQEMIPAMVEVLTQVYINLAELKAAAAGHPTTGLAGLADSIGAKAIRANRAYFKGELIPAVNQTLQQAADRLTAEYVRLADNGTEARQ